LYWISGDNYDYAEGKARIGGTKDAEVFDADIARGCVLWWRREKYITKEQARELWDLNCYDDSSGRAFYDAAYAAHCDPELLSSCEVTSRAVFTAQAVLNRLVEELEARDFRAAAGAWFRRAA
jgi:hypothetical protein